MEQLIKQFMDRYLTREEIAYSVYSFYCIFPILSANLNRTCVL